MLPKIIPTTATTLGLVGDTSIANINSQVVTIGQLYKIVNQLISKVKMPLIKRFSGEKVKLKGFLI
jgi:hypothetical protein